MVVTRPPELERSIVATVVGMVSVRHRGIIIDADDDG